MVPADPSQCGATRKRVVACDSDKLSDEEYILKRKRNNDAVNSNSVDVFTQSATILA
ncbi:hypothetical protein WUBG_04229 [Wuchereria bancrofti]|uniref:Uncharacterized protein n=1 Tax=Wuchereria bancrofti TaxID=6293 RepID=J9F5T1_WUCBA|nr:hypothetical protein WUBG_04229 [Wuchereria bancrofti]